MDNRNELKMRMAEMFGKDTETKTWIEHTVLMLSHVEVDEELDFLRRIQSI